ncbi:hypothetical protein B0H13DRAFT_1892921 [Mycena leptocephala]|nr:hypothetical protein B0H13DRAFT_1892921 [Mycena leptocephala]
MNVSPLYHAQSPILQGASDQAPASVLWVGRPASHATVILLNTVYHAVRISTAPSLRLSETCVTRGPLRQGAAHTPVTPIETAVWLWQATRPPLRVVKPTQPRPPTVYDCSHMKVCKRTVHKKRVELAEKRAVLRSRREQLWKNLRRKAEREIDVLKRVETRLRHEAEEKVGLAEKKRRRKRWGEKSTILVQKLALKQAKAKMQLGRRHNFIPPDCSQFYHFVPLGHVLSLWKRGWIRSRSKALQSF